MAVFLLGCVFGAFVGSFLNVCAHRLPRNESVVHPPSRCYACGTRIVWYDNLPVLGWFLLRGRCRACGSPFSIRYAGGELAVALMTGGLCWLVLEAGLPLVPPELASLWVWPTALHHWGAPGSVALVASLVALLVLVWYGWVSSAIDLRWQIIPDELTKPMQLLGVPLALLLPTGMALGWTPLAWFIDQRLDGTPVITATAGLGWCLLLILPAILALPASIPLARVVYGRWLAPGHRWDAEGLRGLSLGLWWFAACCLLHLLLLVLAVVLASYGAGRAQQMIAALTAVHLAQALLGALTAWWLLHLVALIGSAVVRRTAMGFGDAKFLAPIGAVLGPVGVIQAFFLAALVGTLVGVPMRLSGKGREIPFGPFLAVGAGLTLFIGPRLHLLLMSRLFGVV